MIVVGGGVAGCALAYAFANDGRQVVLLGKNFIFLEYHNSSKFL